MAFELGDNDDGGMNDVNLIPLIDIMLVLMIIFLVTATVLNPTVPLDLPKTSASVNEMPHEVVQVSNDAEGKIYWDKTELTLDDLSKRFAQQVADGKDPQVHLRADKEGRYDTVAQVLATASSAGLTKIAFVND